MKIRFQADADIDPDIRKGPGGTIPDGTLDPEVLRIAAPRLKADMPMSSAANRANNLERNPIGEGFNTRW